MAFGIQDECVYLTSMFTNLSDCCFLSQEMVANDKEKGEEEQQASHSLLST